MGGWTNWLAAALLVSAGVPLARACWANRTTALAHALGWAVAAWFAWIATALDCGAVDGFCFEAGVDPAHAW